MPTPDTRTTAAIERLDSASARVALVTGSLILFISVGARQGFGLFLLPVTQALHVDRETFAIGVAIQYLLWGVLGPFGGLVAGRFGAARVLAAGGIAYALGFAAMAFTNSATGLLMSAGVAIGAGLGAANYGVVHGAVANRFTADRRGRALGLVGAVTAFGQFVLLFFTDSLLTLTDWRQALLWHAALVALIVPLAWGIARRPPTGAMRGPREPALPAIRTALATGDFWLLCAGFAFSGVHVMFTMTHLPAMLADRSLPPRTAVWALAAVSLFAFLGSWLFGRLADRFDKRVLLATLYGARAVFALAILVWPFTPLGLVVYFALLGVFWTSTIPVASALTAERFGAEQLATLFSIVFLAHQIGGFFGTWLGGRVYDAWHDYTPMWLAIAFLCTVGALLVMRMARPADAARPMKPVARAPSATGVQ